jgi:pimeloyl-ACP methyl ester carboxylesterase
MGEVLAHARNHGTQPAGKAWFWHRQLKKPFFGRFMKPWRWPAGVPEQGWQRLSIPSDSHARLSAVLQCTPVQPARGVVVCAHPMGLACKGFWLRQGHAEALLAAGFHVLAFDFNGFGESECTNFDWAADVVAVGQEARRRFPGLPVHALSASFGAMHTLNALTRPDFPFVRVVAEGVPATLPDFWRHYPLPYAFLRASQLVAPQIERRMRPELAITQLPATVRLLLVHSRGDRWTPVAQGERLLRAAPAGAAVQQLTLERADHTHGLRDERDTYWPAVERFLTAD